MKTLFRITMPRGLTMASRDKDAIAKFEERLGHPPNEQSTIGDWWPTLLLDDRIIVVRKCFIPKPPKTYPASTALIDAACQDITIILLEAVLPIFEEFFPGDTRPRKALEIAKTYRQDPTEYNGKVCTSMSYHMQQLEEYLSYQGLETLTDNRKYYAACAVAASASYTVGQSFAAAACGASTARFMMERRAEEMDIPPIPVVFAPAIARLDQLLIDLEALV